MTKSIPILALAALLIPAVAQTQTSPPSSGTEKTLDIYFMDTEGGQATLFVSPAGQAMLVDTGFAGGVVDVPAPSPAAPAAEAERTRLPSDAMPAASCTCCNRPASPCSTTS